MASCRERGACTVAAAAGILSRSSEIRDQVDRVDAYTSAARGLDHALSAAGGSAALAGCHVTSPHPYQARLAWDLGRTTSAVAAPTPGGLAFERAHARDPRLRKLLVRQAGRVTVIRLPLRGALPWALVVLARRDGVPTPGSELRCRALARLLVSGLGGLR